MDIHPFRDVDVDGDGCILCCSIMFNVVFCNKWYVLLCFGSDPDDLQMSNLVRVVMGIIQTTLFFLL